MNNPDLKKLYAPFKEVHWRVGSMTKDKSKAKALAYVDARDVMHRLDVACGPANWQARYPFPGCCEIGIRIDGEWVWKANGADESNVEGVKGQYSDAFKRAAVLWGVGQYLYSLPDPGWLPVDQFKNFTDESRRTLQYLYRKYLGGE